MKPCVATKVKIAALTSEIDAIFHANSSYWCRGENVTHEARAEYQFSIERLEAIRQELAQLLSVLSEQASRLRAESSATRSLSATPRAGNQPPRRNTKNALFSRLAWRRPYSQPRISGTKEASR